MIIIYLIPLIGFFTLIFSFFQSLWVIKHNPGCKKIQNIGKYISDGSISFLKSEYKYIFYFVLFVIFILFYLSYQTKYINPVIIISFILGSIFSALSGIIGMKIATKTNIRTTQAAKSSLLNAFRISFFGGTVMGVSVTGLSILGLGLLFLFFIFLLLPEGIFSYNKNNVLICIEILTGFSLGSESIALFARVGGGIYTKAVDIGADLVGKIEKNIPEDDIRNPAVIADNVGDNVGDIAGMGADLFGSFVATILSAMLLGCEIDTLYLDNFDGLSAIILPIFLCSFGILLSIFSFFFISIKTSNNIQGILDTGNIICIFLNIIFSFFIVNFLLPDILCFRDQFFSSMDVFFSVLIGLFVGIFINFITEYFTSMHSFPVKFIVNQSFTGYATNIIAGLSVGMFSTVFPIIIFALAIYSSFYFAGFYGVAMSAVGMMSTTAMQLSIDAFGPIADNAGGIAEMSQLDVNVRKRTDILDMIGNTTAAIGKGFAIASAALTSLALFSAFVGIVNIKIIDIYKASVLSGLFLGGMIPFFFSSFIIKSVSDSAMLIVEEVRSQFSKGIMEGKFKPDYERCIDISTQYSINSIIFPITLSIFFPIFLGFILGPEVLGGFLSGLTVSGVLMAIFQSNAGGAWDNAKKTFEKGILINGLLINKKSDFYKSSVVGDTVGDPFKDASGPSMNILIKLSFIIALIISPYIIEDYHIDFINKFKSIKLVFRNFID